MNTVISLFSHSHSGVPALQRRLGQRLGQLLRLPLGAGAAAQAANACQTHIGPPHQASRSKAMPSKRPLRIVRIVEPRASHAAPPALGRMVISGRMEDVCAELERMCLAAA